MSEIENGEMTSNAAEASRYYILHHRYEDGIYIDGDVTFSPPLAGYYYVGQDVIPPDTQVRLKLERRSQKMDRHFFLTTCGAFFVSEALKDVLTQHHTALDFIATDAVHANKTPTKKTYFLAHAKKMVKCFDYANSDYAGKNMVLRRRTEGTFSTDYKVRGITKLCIDHEQAAGLDFLFIDDTIWIDPVVSRAVVDSANSLGLQLNVEACG
ncbi:hypothetical protein FXN63_24485 [Pigmentiphaga aceris]|uniref:Immunity MXAN-0049 protein domain-containing protein n=1 Tax=Pigmentiphaga aceris TaxID=1940612 RepID=A0A5C0B1H3_9BURK|nr:DUF1629 domain-containing protein [Pigmentiphaga aceris]QEI08649.1 hypothetical protein FXN63_24485 [Pigmentiphaga aceris]